METVEAVEPTETYSFEKKFLDKGLGLNGYTVFVFAIGVILILFVSKFFLSRPLFWHRAAV